MWNRIARQGPLWFQYAPHARIKRADIQTDTLLILSSIAVFAMIVYMIVDAIN